jgi:hypothetical protein
MSGRKQHTISKSLLLRNGNQFSSSEPRCTHSFSIPPRRIVEPRFLSAFRPRCLQAVFLKKKGINYCWCLFCTWVFVLCGCEQCLRRFGCDTGPFYDAFMILNNTASDIMMYDGLEKDLKGINSELTFSWKD